MPKTFKWNLLLSVIIVLQNSLFANDSSQFPEQLSQEAKMSILIASPSSQEVYTMYGHAGYRVIDTAQNLDITFNYGIFSFSDDFLFRFIKGKTDYMVMPQYTVDYMSEYLGRGSNVTELSLNLNPQEVERVWAYLLNNIRPENRTYRYHFFKDNCSTRPVWLADMAVGGLVFPSNLNNKHTWREEINDLEAGNSWLVLGTDLALGTPTDQAMSSQDLSFSPRQLKELLSNTLRKDGKPIVSQIEEYKATPQGITEQEHTITVSPITCIMSLFWTIVYLYGYRIIYKKKHTSFIIDSLILGIVGLEGSILFYISAISEHPFVSPNYNLWLIHPLHLLLGLPLMLIPRLRHWAVWYHFANFVAISAFMIVAYFLPQHFNIAVFPLALSLMIMSSARYWEHRCSPHR